MNILTADIGGTNTKMCICDKDGNIDLFQEYATESHLGGPHVINRLMSKMEEYDHFDVIAISTAGQVNSEEGFIVFANENIPEYTGMRVKNIVESRFHKPVKIENDVNAAALGEAHFGAARASDHFLCLTYGTGIGGAIIINRQIYKGTRGVAAEFGHMLTRPAARGSDSGGRPYYEKFASTTALIRMARKVEPECVNGRLFFEMLAQGNEVLQRILDEWVDEVATGLGSLIHIFNPSTVVIGGGVMEQEHLVRIVEARTKELIMSSFQDVEILKAELGNKAGVLGAASLFLR